MTDILEETPRERLDKLFDEYRSNLSELSMASNDYEEMRNAVRAKGELLKKLKIRVMNTKRIIDLSIQKDIDPILAKLQITDDNKSDWAYEADGDSEEQPKARLIGGNKDSKKGLFSILHRIIGRK